MCECTRKEKKNRKKSDILSISSLPGISGKGEADKQGAQWNRLISNPSVCDLAGGLNVRSESAVLGGSAPDTPGASMLCTGRKFVSDRDAASRTAAEETRPDRGSSVLVRGGVS